MSDRETPGADDVAAALAILRDAGFPVERLRVLPAADDTAVSAARRERHELTSNERTALLAACRAALADGEARTAKELHALVRGQVAWPLTKKEVSSVLARDGKDCLLYDREAYTYQIRE